MLGKIKKPKASDVSKHDKDEWNAYLAGTRGLERDYMQEIVDSRSTWRKVGLACFAFAIVVVLWHQFMPVTHQEPFVLRVDNTTGAVETVTTLNEQEKSYGEVVDEYFIASYIRSYESYNYQSIQSDYDKVNLMSNNQVARQYQAIYDPSKGVARDEELGKTGIREVNIISVVPDIDKSLATVRFETKTTQVDGTSFVENWIATLTYEYVQTGINDDIRLINPLGFVVTSYRVDRENIR